MKMNEWIKTRITSRALSGPLVTLLTVAFFMVAGLPASAQTSSDVFGQVIEHYEKAYRSLTQDSIDDVPQAGEHIVKLLAALEADFNAEKAGIDAASAASIRELLPELKKAGAQLAAAGDLTTARDAFYALSKPLVRWRKAAASEDRPVVAYCSMTRRSWLQPEGETIANPYHGQSMLRCGEVVDR